MQLIHLQSSELTQAHIHNSPCLNIIEIEALHQVLDSLLWSLRCTYDMHYLVDIVASNNQSLKYVGTILCFLQVKLGATYSHVMTMVNEMLNTLLEREQLRPSVNKGDAVDRERALQSSHLEELVQYHIGIGITSYVNNDTHTLTSRLVVDIGDTLNLLLSGKVGDVFHQVGLVDTVWNLRYDNLVVSVASLYLCLGSHDNASTTSLIGILNALYSIYICSRWEIRSLDKLHESVGVNILVVDICAATVNHLTQVVGRNIGGHTHGDTITSIDEKIRNLCRHHTRLYKRVVEVVHHIHGVLLQVVHDMLTHLRKAALSVTHGSRRIAIHRTEVTLSVNKCVSHRPILGHTHQCAIYGAVSVGVILTEHLTDDARTLLVRVITCIANTHHTIKDTTVYGLESVSHIREGTCYNHRHRIVDV